jgi:hypothetical protein
MSHVYRFCVKFLNGVACGGGDIHVTGTENLEISLAMTSEVTAMLLKR